MRGLGWVPDAAPSDEERARHIVAVGGLLGTARPLAASLSRMPAVSDQGSSEACTAFFGANAVYALTGFHGSPWCAWWIARVADGTFPANAGVSVSSMLRALESHGFPPVDAWGPGSTHASFGYDQAPPALARIGGQKHRLAVTPIWGTGDAVVDAVCGALAQDLPVGIVVDVDAGFDRPTNGFVGPATDEGRGRHMTTLAGYRSGSTGVEFLNVNSWGTGWGTNGTAWLSADRVRSAPFACFARAA